MGNLSHTVGGTDNLVSFKSTARVPIDSLKVHFSPIQEGEGDPSPENVRPIRGWNEVEAYRSGKNIARITGYDAMNTASADIHDRISNTYGTTISTNDYSLPDTSVIVAQTQAPDVSTVYSYQNGYFAIMIKNLIFDQYYDVSFKITDITNNLLNCDINAVRIIVPNGSSFSSSEINGNRLIFKNVKWKRNASHPDRSQFEIRNCGMSFTLSEFMVTPVGMNDGVFEPYCGEVIPVTFPVTGKNKFNGEISNVNIGNKGEILNINSSRISSSLVPIIHGQYTLSCSENYPVAIYAYDDNGFIATESLVTWQESPATFMIENAKYVRFKWKKSDDSAFSLSEITNIQLELGSEATTYELYNSDNTIYGGYIDLINGEFVSGWTKIKIKDIDWTYSTSQRRFQFAFPKTDLMGSSADIQWSNCAIAEAYTTSTMNGYQNLQIATWKNTNIYIRDDRFSNVEDFIATMGDTYISYPIANKTTYPLTAVQLKTFLDNNSFWSNTNDVTEVSYAVHDSVSIRDARKRILAASPHLETASDGFINFSTDISAPLKECKVYFEPVQEGEGDPSPENVRPISGWNGLEVTHNNVTIPITFPTEAGTIYGGYVDLVNGEIVEEYALFEKTWGEFTVRGTLSNTDYKSMDLDKDIYMSREYLYISKLSNIVPYSYSWTENDSPHFYISASRRIYVWLPIGTEASTMIQIIGHLKEPIHYPIDPQTLKTLRGTNNIWSTSNGPISIKYWKH